MLTIISTVIASLLISYSIILWTKKPIFGYVGALLIIHFAYYIQGKLFNTDIEFSIDLPILLLTVAVIGSSVIAHIAWTIYCLKTGKNIKTLDELD